MNKHLGNCGMTTDLSIFKNKSIFITGHTGFKGAWLAFWLQELGAKVTGYALDPYYQESLFDKLGLAESINHIIADVLRPFLEKWQAGFRYWWENCSNPRVQPMERQEAYPELAAFLDEWRSLRLMMRRVEREILRRYRLLK